MAEDYLSAQKVQQLTALDGRAKVTFPYDDAAFPVIERILNVPWEDWELVLESPDEEYPGAILILQQKLSEDDQIAKVYRRWETLSGPYIPFTRYDENLGPIQGRRKAVLNTGQTASLTATGKITYEARDTSALVAWQVEEGWSDGTGSAGNPAYPINYTSSHDPERGVVDQTSQIVTGASGLHGSIAISGSTFTEIAYQPFNEFLDRKVISTFTLPAELLTRDQRDEEKGPVQITTQLVAATGSEVGSSAESGGVVTDISYEPINDLVLRKSVATFTVPCPVQTRYEVDEETNYPVTITTQIIATPASNAGYGSGNGTATAFRPITSVYGRKVITTLFPGVNWAVATLTIERTKISPYRYPPLVFGPDYAASGFVVAEDGTTRLILNWLRRGGRVANVPTTTIATYGAKDSLTLPTSYFDPVLANLIYQGVFVNISEIGVLNDGFSYVSATASDNPKWPAKAERVGFGASALSATEYMALVNTGSIQIVAAEKEEWKYGLWRMVVTKVPIR